MWTSVYDCLSDTLCRRGGIWVRVSDYTTNNKIELKRRIITLRNFLS